MTQPVIEARGIVNQFGAQRVHDGLDLTVLSGEIFGIVGGSGSGKSVLLNTILGLRRPQAGEVRIEGTDITRLDDAALRSFEEAHHLGRPRSDAPTVDLDDLVILVGRHRITSPR